MIKCSVCGYDNPDDSQSCLNCGSPIERRKLGQAIDDINGEATVLIGTPLVPPANKPSASTNPVPPPPPPAPRAPALPPPMPAPAPSYAPPAAPPPPAPSHTPPPAGYAPLPQSHSMPSSFDSQEVELAKKFGYISIGLGISSIICCLGGAVLAPLGCLSFLEWVSGIVVGIIGLKKAGTDPSARQLNIIGIAINLVILVLSLLAAVVMMIFFGGIAAVMAGSAAAAN